MINFSINHVKELAIFLAQLEREGVTYKVSDHYECGCFDGWSVELTGGF